jgi:hypothetical protein
VFSYFGQAFIFKEVPIFANKNPNDYVIEVNVCLLCCNQFYLSHCVPQKNEVQEVEFNKLRHLLALKEQMSKSVPLEVFIYHNKDPALKKKLAKKKKV